MLSPDQEVSIRTILAAGGRAGYTLVEASIVGDEVRATYRKGGKTVRVRLRHPSKADTGAVERTPSVAIEVVPPARDLARALAQESQSVELRWVKGAEAPRVQDDEGDPRGDPEGDPEQPREGEPEDPATVARRPPASPDEILFKAQHALETRDFDVVRRWLRALLDAYGDAVWAQREAALYHRRMGDQEAFRTAIDAADARLAELPEARRRYEAARNAIVRGDLKGAMAALDALLEAAKGDADTVCGMAGAVRDLLRLEEDGKAFDLASRIAEAAPGCREAYLTLAEAARRLRRSKEALPLLRAGAERLPEDSAVVTQYADTLKNLGQREKAIAIFEDLVARGHHDPSLLGSLLGLYTRQRVTQALAESWRRKADADPGDFIAAFFAGVLLHYRGAYDQSNRYLERARRVLTTEPRVYIYLAMNHFHLGDQEQARRLIERAVRLGHADPDVYYCRAEIVIDEDPKLAIRDMERYLALTEGRIDVFEPKQAKVAAKLERLRACVGARVPSECVATAQRTQGLLYGALAAGAVVLGALGFFLLRRRRS